ncbi:hypothetical protein CYLTODRAFT_460596 [Cylindrobasidium torrendii FP15055 ss-10]|uniref:Uncharacterized protein n=1 Tax=Cylindrobasidium torrendii FP15055 ss-10 TaxID=1314674 RepID=A0A0D7AQJ5_9AGAR|nr:hypothetical protein CYLTODRAFT_460596 [Cylindrobasidium torrendii FP15055 ss-10]
MVLWMVFTTITLLVINGWAPFRGGGDTTSVKNLAAPIIGTYWKQTFAEKTKDITLDGDYGSPMAQWKAAWTKRKPENGPRQPKRTTFEYVRAHEREVLAMPDAERRAYLRGMEMQAHTDERMAAAIARQQEREAEEGAARVRAMAFVQEQEIKQVEAIKAEWLEAEG